MLRNLSPSIIRISQIFYNQKLLQHCNLFSDGTIILSVFLFLTYDIKSMIVILLVMIRRSLLTTILMSSVRWVMMLLAGCIRLDLKNWFQPQQPHPPNHNLHYITLRGLPSATLPFLLSLNTKLCGKVGIEIPLKLLVPSMLRIFLMMLMFHQLMVTLTYLG